MIDTGHRRCHPTWPFGQTLVFVLEKPIGLFGILQGVASSFSFPKELVASFLSHRAGEFGEIAWKNTCRDPSCPFHFFFVLSILTWKVEVGDVTDGDLLTCINLADAAAPMCLVSFFFFFLTCPLLAVHCIAQGIQHSLAGPVLLFSGVNRRFRGRVIFTL